MPDPTQAVSAGLGSASGAFPWSAAIQGGLGLLQTIFSGKKKAERNLENYANSYQPNSSILDYYQKAYNKYNPNAYQSAEYQNRTNQIGRNLTTGINAAQDRHGALGVIGGLTQGANDASANAASSAEAAQRQNLGQLGQATQMKASEDAKKWDMKYNLLSAKAGGANANQSAGINNIFGAANSFGQLQMAKQIYGG